MRLWPRRKVVVPRAEPVVAPPVTTAEQAQVRRYSDLAVAALGRAPAALDAQGQPRVLSPYTMAHSLPAPGVLPPSHPIARARKEGNLKLAMDQAGISAAWDWAGGAAAWQEGVVFMGYPYLSELSQRSEYRRPVEILAEDMTREWIEFTVEGDDEAKASKEDRVKELEAAFKSHNVQGLFRDAIEQDGYFGRGHIYVDVKDAWQDDAELQTPLDLKPEKIGKGDLKRLQRVEPLWVYPGAYDATDPLNPAYFKPQNWWVNARVVDHSRLLTFVSRPMPDLLKPAYQFGGISTTQMMKPYVDNWLRSRQSVSDLLFAFSVMVLSTNLDELLTNGAVQQLLLRLDAFVRCRDNRGVMAIDKSKEDLKNVSAPLGTVDALLAMSQEQMSAPSGLPLVVLFGVTPKGLNATAEPELVAYRASLKARQERVVRPNLTKVMHVIMLDLWGEIDDGIDFTFKPLIELSAKEQAELRKADAETDGQDLDRGVLSPAERRRKLVNAPDSDYADLDPDEVPEPPQPGSAEELELGGHEEQGAEGGEEKAAA